MSTRSVIEKYMNHMFTGDFVAAFEMFAPDGQYIIIGDTPVSGTYTGPDHIKRDLLGLLAERFITPPVVSCTNIIVENDRGVALGFGEGPASKPTATSPSATLSASAITRSGPPAAICCASVNASDSVAATPAPAS